MRRSITLIVLFLLVGMVAAEPPSGEKARDHVSASPAGLQLALAPEQVERYMAEQLGLPLSAPFSPTFDFEAAMVPETENVADKKEPFQPHGSLVRRELQEVSAYELLKRERFDIHGSFSIGIDSEGRWYTSVEFNKQLTPSFSLGLGFSVMRGDRWGLWE